MKKKSNGIGKKYFVVGGAVSLITAGVALLSGTVHAELTTEQVSQSFDVMTNSLEVNHLAPEREKEKATLEQKSFFEGSEGQKVYSDEMACEAEVTSKEQEHDEVASSIMQVDDPIMLQETVKDIPVEPKHITDEQELYVLKALNLQDAYAILQSGAVENLRLFGDNVDRIEFDKNGKRIYAADDGDAFAKLLYMLYPSNAGSLSVNGGGDRLNFSKYGSVSPETMAKFCAILNDYRSEKISRIPKKNVKVVFPGIGCKNKINLKVEGSQSMVQGNLAEFLKRYGFKDEEMYTIDVVKGKEKVSFNKATFYYDFVKILLDCVDLEKDKEAQYPQYLTEHILMSYMIKILGRKDEFERFYKEIVIRFTQNESQNVKISDERKFVMDDAIVAEETRLSHLNEIIKSAKFIDMSPYKTCTKEHKILCKVGAICDDGQVQIKSDTFADCADITLRHLVNLLVYSDKQNWDVFFKDTDIEDLDEKLKKVVDSINDNSRVKFYDLKTRLQMFFLYQRGKLRGFYTDKYRSENGADDETNLARILWAYAICNMDVGNLKKGPDRDKGYYEIQYCENSNVALDCGYINLLKLMWNVAKALDLDEVKLSEARRQIDGLNSHFKKPSIDVSDELKNVLSSVFTLFHKEKNLKIDIENCKCEKVGFQDEITGEIRVEVNKDGQVMSFHVIQQKDHAKVDHVPVDFTWDDKFISKEYCDDFSKLLLKSFTKGTNNYKKVSDPLGFYGEFFGDFESFGSSSNALYVLRVLQDEGHDVENLSLIDSGAIMHAEKINVKQKVQSEMEESKTIVKKLSDVFYEEYLKPSEDEISLDWDQSLYVYEKNRFGTLDVYSGPEHTDAQKISGFEVIKTSYDGDEVRLIIDDSEENVIIPIELYDSNGKKLKVAIGRWDHLDDLETVTFKGDCENLKIMQFTFKKELGNLRSVNFLGYVKNLTIGEGAFFDSDLTDFTFLGSVANLVIEKFAFAGSQLKSFTVSGSITNLTIGINAISFNQLKGFNVLGEILNFTIGEYAFAFSDMTSFIVPSRVTNLIIADGAFGFSSLESFVIPEGVKCLKIGSNSFAKSLIESFTVPESVIDLIVGEHAFAESEVTSFAVLGHISDLKVSDSAFKDSQLESFVISEGIKNIIIDNNAFAGSQLENFEIPKSVMKATIGAKAFAESEITSLIFLGDATDLLIDESAFKNCSTQIEFVRPARKRKRFAVEF